MKRAQVRRLIMTLSAIVLLWQPMEAQSQRALTYSSKQCNEYAIEFQLDPRPFQNLVGPGFSLDLSDGKARVIIVVHDCSVFWLNGTDVGPAQEVRVWVSVHGLGDVRPVVGAEQTRPTQTWFSVLEGTSNPRVFEVKRAAGISETRVDSTLLEPPGAGRGGRVYMNGSLAFSWHVPSPAVPSIRLLGLNIDMYRRDSTGNAVLNQIQALMHMSVAPSSGALEVSGLAGVVPSIKPGTYAASVRAFFPMWSRATLGLIPSRQ
jgi:hypothetical protein